MNYKEHFNKFWIPILQKQYFKCMIEKDKKAVKELEDGIRKNWNLTRDEKVQVIRKIRGVK